MKKLILSLAFSICILHIHAQDQNMKKETVPALVMDEFRKDYPLEKNINWKKKGEYYCVDFEARDMYYSVLYTSSGALLYTSVKLLINDLPDDIREYLTTQYPDQINMDAKKIIKADNLISYSVEVDGVKVFFDEQGGFIGETMLVSQ